MSTFPIPYAEPTTQAAFDYSALASGQADRVERAANRIRALEDALRKQVEMSAIEIGRTLIEVKDTLSSGQFGKWLIAEFGWSDRTARNFMSAARLADEKSEIVSVLPPTGLYKLASASTPETCVNDVIQRLEAGERLSAKTIGDLVTSARKQEGRERAMDKKLRRKLSWAPPAKHDAIRKADERRRQAIERENEKDLERHRLRQKANEDAAAFLQQHLGPQFKDFAALFEAGTPYGFAEVLRLRRANDGGDA
ncbi:DUF3102 domain-containing protein [Methylobacterium sp. J-078]|uniref:DUF3102 domain-containing protein n=1 Tax=Methylobacterium sp. J-078 TaxID=2836657 RepID=UPI001FBAA1CB|nr:DUF3102 domain-containing protein [Methylobacterium sp. J-078]MCJ2043065.1 DUF3102 domain-containing protein [Methylobacterium sp. J-078]